MSKKSSTFAPAFEIYVSLAQLVEQLTLNQWVESSSLSGDTKDAIWRLFLCLFVFLMQIYLHISKKSSNFVADL